MATWFDLPSEVKQMIFCMVSDVDSIIYVPRDRRRKVDPRYMEAHHFHDLLLVSKTFITPAEFAFAVLGSARLTFYSYNEIRRLIAEVPSSFKESIRDIHLSRTHVRNKTFIDTFNGFCTIENTLSTHMPQLRRIHISWPEYCAQVALCQMPTPSGVADRHEACSSLVEAILSEQPREHILGGRILHQNPVSQLAASFIGDRTGRGTSYNWIRPLAWIRRLIAYAEDNNIEVILHIEVCVGFVCQRTSVLTLNTNRTRPWHSCWSLHGGILFDVATWQTHLKGMMSSKDYMLRVEYDERQFAYHQKLAYDLLHSSVKRGLHSWLDMLEEVNPRSPTNRSLLTEGDGF